MRQCPQLPHAGRQARGVAPQPGGTKWGGHPKPTLAPGPARLLPPPHWPHSGGWLLGARFVPQLLASASYDDTVKLYQEEEDDWVCCATLEGHESTVWSVAFDRSGERLASCSDDKTVRIWRRYKPGNEEGEAGGHGARDLLGKKRVGGKSRQGAAATRWPCRGGLQRQRAHVEVRLHPLRLPLQDHLRRGMVSGASPLPPRGSSSSQRHCGGRGPGSAAPCSRCHLTGALATACGDDAIRVFEESATGDPRQPTFTLAAHVPRAHAQDVNCVAWHPKEPGLLASCGDDGDIAFWRYQRPESC